MKVRVSIETEERKDVIKELTDHGIGISDEARYVLSLSGEERYLQVKDERGDRVAIRESEIVFIESFGHNIDVHATSGKFVTSERMYKLEEGLDKKCFIRISNSVIIQKKYVTRIRPGLSMKFTLTMADGTVMTVTRSYYTVFREFFKI